jgi:hypothetical protein
VVGPRADDLGKAHDLAVRVGNLQSHEGFARNGLDHADAVDRQRRVTEGYTIRDLELCLGEDHHKIQKWIANGWLRDRLQGTHRHNGNGHDIHRFREKDILAFVRKHPMEINLGKVDQVWFLDLVLLKGSNLSDSQLLSAP